MKKVHLPNPVIVSATLLRLIRPKPCGGLVSRARFRTGSTNTKNNFTRICRTAGFPLVGLFLLLSCAPRQVRTVPPSSASAKAPAEPRCPDRVDRAKTGGFVGGLFGTAVATLVGSPLLGGLYQAAGYAMGFASDGACPKTAAVKKTALTPTNGDVRVEQAVLAPQPRPPVLSSTEIKEENLSTNGRP